MVRRELRMEREIHVAVDRARLTRHAELRATGPPAIGFGIEHAVANQAEPAFPLGHEHVAVGEKSHAPRKRERLSDDDDRIL